LHELPYVRTFAGRNPRHRPIFSAWELQHLVQRRNTTEPARSSWLPRGRRRGTLPAVLTTRAHQDASWRPPAPILLIGLRKHVRATEATAVNAIARETYEMNQVALLTPTYGRDLEICTLLCESVDRHITSFAKHYLLVPDCDLPLFAPLASERRVIIPDSAYLPGWLRPLPRVIQRKRRQFWWSLRAKPVSGWHVQQFLKIAAVMSLPHH